MKKHLLRITAVLTIALFTLVLFGNTKLAANCPGGTILVHVTGQDIEEEPNGDKVFWQAGGHLVYCPSTGMVIEDHSYWYISMIVQ